MKTFQNSPPLLLPLLLLLSVFNFSSGVPPPQPVPEEYNHLQFVQTWTPTVCQPVGRMACVSPLPQYYANNFSMHGLWPAKRDGATLRVPTNKTTALISDEVFDKLKVPLAKWWAVIDLQWKPETEFYQNEWQKHGQMGLWGEGDKATEAFLNDGIKARQGINLLDILHKAGLHFNTPYTKAQIVNAMQRQLGVANVYISCKNNDLLHELLICLDKMTHRIISCPPDNKPRSCTGTHLKIPV